MDRRRAEDELANVLADVRRGIWQPPVADTAPEEQAPRPTFHVFASAWLARRRLAGLAPRTIEADEWALSCHLLPFFARLRVDAINVEQVDAYTTAKLRERAERLVDRPLSNGSINATLNVLAAVLEDAVEYGHLAVNPARGRRRRLRAAKPRRASLAAEQVRALLDAAGAHRALLATAIMAGGLRVGELCALRWRDVHLAAARLTVHKSKTDAGVREVDLTADAP